MMVQNVSLGNDTNGEEFAPLSGPHPKALLRWISPAPAKPLFPLPSEVALLLSLARMVATPCLRPPPDPPPRRVCTLRLKLSFPSSLRNHQTPQTFLSSSLPPSRLSFELLSPHLRSASPDDLKALVISEPHRLNQATLPATKLAASTPAKNPGLSFL